VTRWLLGNAHDEGLRVHGNLHVSTGHRIPDKRVARLPRSGDLGEVIPLCLASLILIMSEVVYNGADEGLCDDDLAERQGF
jgi:hypothetical protein